MRIVLCQLNPTMGDIDGNVGLVEATLASTGEQSPDLLVFPELFIQGYPPRDLLENRWFIEQGTDALQRLCKLSVHYPGVGIVVGCALPHDGKSGIGLANSAVLVCDGAVVFRQDKSLLPSYDVFDENRYFDPAGDVEVVPFKGEVLGITICEDAWNSDQMWSSRHYDRDPVAIAASKGATVLINISGSPFHLGKQKDRFRLMETHATKHRRHFIFVNQVGGNDELVFDGASLYFDSRGGLRALLPAFSEATVTVDTSASGEALQPYEFDCIGSVYDALVLGLRDYMRKCGFEGAVVGLSGGIDSAVTCALASAALGSTNVLGVTMPSRYSSEGSVTDSRQLARNLGIAMKEIPIEPAFRALLETMNPHFGGSSPGIAEENMQARIRGNILMALSNKFGYLLLSTGNKSEMAVGYCTLYGDMNGGLSVISDLPKTMVYKLAEFINSAKPLIPPSTIEKPPSAELRDDQRDQDTLPPYDILDGILQLLVEEGLSRDEIVARGFTPETVDWIVRAVRTNEYKRRQAAPGLKVTPKAFGSGRRFPIAARYRV